MLMLLFFLQAPHRVLTLPPRSAVSTALAMWLHFPQGKKLPVKKRGFVCAPPPPKLGCSPPGRH